MAVKSVFDIKCFKDVNFWVEQLVYIRYIEIRKHLLKYHETLFCKRSVLIYLHARELFVFSFSSADFLQNLVFKNKPPRTTIRVSNSLDPDQDRHYVGLHLGSNCLQKAIGRRQNYPLACKEL